MKSLWIVNKCCGALHQKLYNKKATGGLWLEAMLEEASQDEADKIIVVNVEKIPRLRVFRNANITYYTIPGRPNARYSYLSNKAKQLWLTIIESEKPDVIIIWGTEFPYGLGAINVAPNIPTVVYIQGILDSIAKYYLSGLNKSELRKACTLRDILTGSTIKQIQQRYEKRVLYEQEIVKRAKHIIIENRWAEAYFRKTCPEVIVHYMPICISNSFSNTKWSEDKMHPHTIMCSAANYPVKGLHMLLKALQIVKRRYPDVHLYVPGTVLNTAKSIKSRIKQNGYERLISHMIIGLGLQENVSYTGRLTADEMAMMMSVMNCFVMCSSIENHSSTLKEAMMVGTPCIASYVGGVPEYAINEYNCLLYRFEDYEVLALNIIRLFENFDLRSKLSKNAIRSMLNNNESSYLSLRKICEKVSDKGEYLC